MIQKGGYFCAGNDDFKVWGKRGYMPGLQAISRTPSLGRVQHAVRPLLRPADSFGQAVEACAGSAAGGDNHAPRKPIQGGCFAGAEGAGCELSQAEKTILASVWREPMSWEV